MKCPKCSNMETRVADSRIIEDWLTIRRRRVCELCDYRFTTFEKTWITDLLVLKSDWTKQIYDKIKIKKALMLAFAKRNITLEELEDIISKLEIKWLWIWKEVSSKQIWDDILEILKDVDIVAYIRFASVYKKFENVEDFKSIIESS